MTNAAPSDYTQAPATKLLATHCAVCSRPLLDAVSVETGIGPICRRQHGYGTPDIAADWQAVDAALAGTPALEAITTGVCDARVAANHLVYRIAIEQDGRDVKKYVMALGRLGFTVLAARIAQRLRAVVVTQEGNEYVVTAPYSEAFNAALKLARVTALFDKKTKARRVACGDRQGLWTAIRNGFPRETLVFGGKCVAML